MPDNKSGKSGCVAAVIVALAFVSVLLLWTCFAKVPANAVGVRTNANGGIEKRDFPPGFVLCVPGLHSVRLWDPTWTNAYQHLNVRGSDQYITAVDVSVIFRIKPENCHEIAGKFSTYAAIEQNVDLSLSRYANEILRNIKYDESYEKLLHKKQIAGQTLSLESAKTEQAIGEMETEKIKTDADAEVVKIVESIKQETENRTAANEQEANKLLQDAQLEAAVITAKAQSENRVKKSQAEFLRAEATAFGVAALARVYAKPGANFYFAQKSLSGLKLGNIEVNSSTFNPLDADHLLHALGLDLHAASPNSAPTGGSSTQK